MAKSTFGAAYDLYAHDFADRDRMYTIDRSQCPDLYIGQNVGREMLIVPRVRLLSIYHQLRAAGIDVRLEPRCFPTTSEAEDA
jgi:hypothetical protein